jgi:hypothetical protein
MTGPEYNRLRALVRGLAITEEARADLLGLIDRCAEAENIRLDLQSALWDIQVKAKVAVDRAEKEAPSRRETDAR